MLSRVAENLFWVGRNVERSLNICRLLDATYQVQLGEFVKVGPSSENGPNLAPVLRILGLQESRSTGSARLLNQLRQMTFGRAEDHTIATLLSQAKENTRATQNIIGGEPFAQLNRLSHAIGTNRMRIRFKESPSLVLNQIGRGCLLFFALVYDSQPRAAPWHFMNLGRQIESIGMMARILFEGLATPLSLAEPPGFVHWAWLLNSCAARDSFMSRHPEGIHPVNLIDQLLLTEEFPHSIRFRVIQARTSLEAIAIDTGVEQSRDAARLIGRLDALLKYMEAREVLEESLDEVLGDIQWTCDRISEQLYASYF